MLRAIALALRARLRGLRWLRVVFLTAHPPLLFKEGNMLARRFIHTFYDRALLLESTKYARS